MNYDFQKYLLVFFGFLRSIFHAVYIFMSGILPNLSSTWLRLRVEAAGVSYNELLEGDFKEDISRYKVLGNLVFITCAWAFVGSIFFFSELFSSLEDSNFFIDYKLSVILVFSGLWAYLIFNLDRMFLGSMIGTTGLKRLMVGSVRLLMAACLGYIISHPLKILYFTPEINAYEAKISSDYIKERLKEIDKIKPELQIKQKILAEEVDSFYSASPIVKEINKANENYGKAEEHYYYADCLPGDPPKAVNGKVLECPEYQPSNKKRISDIYQYGRINLIELPNESFLFEFSNHVYPGCQRETKNSVYQDYIDKYSSKLVNESDWKKYNAAHKNHINNTSSNGEKLSSCRAALIIKSQWQIHKSMLDKELGEDLESISNQTNYKIAKAKLDQETAKLNNIVEEEKNLLNNVIETRASGYIAKTNYLWHLSKPPSWWPFQKNSDASVLNQESHASDHKEKSEDAVFESNNQITVFFMSLVVSLIFIVFESAPILTKLMSQAGAYEQSLAKTRLEKEATYRKMKSESIDLAAAENRYYIKSKEQQLIKDFAMQRERDRLNSKIESALSSNIFEQLELVESFEEKQELMDKYSKLLTTFNEASKKQRS